jgi:hypothetical protein
MIVKAAILHKDVIYTGRRHSDIIIEAQRDYGILLGSSGQGFITDTEEFLDRESARIHFVNSGQVPKKGKFHHQTMLFSEDLY